MSASDPLDGDAGAQAGDVEARLGHRFGNAALLAEALTHRSVASPNNRRGGRRSGLRRAAGSNERLEFVGDRVLGLVVAEWLLERFPDEQEGELGPRHAALVSRQTLATVAEALGLERAISMAPELARGGIAGLGNVLADALEAIFGAMFLDAGLDPVRRLVRARFETAVAANPTPPKDAKTLLQEWLAARRAPPPVYAAIAAEGPSHAPRFEIEVTGAGLASRGTAGGKREAERLAAAALLARLEAGEAEKFGAPARRRRRA